MNSIQNALVSLSRVDELSNSKTLKSEKMAGNLKRGEEKKLKSLFPLLLVLHNDGLGGEQGKLRGKVKEGD